MTISMIFAWCAVFFALLAGFRYVARISKKPSLNRFFHKLHIPAGLLSLLFGLAHGLLAGNIPGWPVEIGAVLFSFNWGTAAFLLLVLLLLSCHLKKPLKKRWMPLHRIATVLLAVVLIVHIADMGIHIFDRKDPISAPEPAAVSDSLLPSPVPSPVSWGSSALEEVSPSATIAVPSPALPSPSADAQVPSPAPPSPSDDAQVSSVETPSSYMQEDIPEPSPEEIRFSGAVLADGIYTGSGRGHKGEITVEVTVEQGQVVSVAVLSQQETPKYFARAVGILDTITQQQSLQVDAVSGATHSSDGLVEAVRDALSGAVVEGELQTDEA